MADKPYAGLRIGSNLLRHTLMLAVPLIEADVATALNALDTCCAMIFSSSSFGFILSSRFESSRSP